VNLFLGWRAKAQRRKEIGENLRDLPEISRLGTFVYLARKGAEAQRKTLCGLASLREYILFYSRKAGKTQRN
jgi:hypothetical protein